MGRQRRFVVMIAVSIASLAGAGAIALPAGGLAAVPRSGIASLIYPYEFTVSGDGVANYGGGGSCGSFTEHVRWALGDAVATAGKPQPRFHMPYGVLTVAGDGADSSISVQIAELGNGSCTPGDNGPTSGYPQICGTSSSTVNRFVLPITPAGYTGSGLGLAPLVPDPGYLAAYGDFTGGGPCPYASMFFAIPDGNPLGGPATEAGGEPIAYLSGPATSMVRSLSHYCNASLSRCRFPRTIRLSGRATRSFCQGSYDSDCHAPTLASGSTWRDDNENWRLTIRVKKLSARRR